MTNINDLPTRRRYAKQSGNRFYYTGKPCTRGHISKRYTSTAKCIECSVIDDALYKERHPDKHKKMKRESGIRYRKNNQEVTKQRKRDYYNKNQTSIRKKANADYAANPESNRARANQWYADNSERAKANSRQYMMDNPEKTKQNRSVYKKVNADKVNALAAQRRAAKVNATPLWIAKKYGTVESPEDKKYWAPIRKKFRAEIELFYTEARRLTEMTGIPHEVDHIWPLQSPDGAGQGLHVPNNLQILTGADNASKNNKNPDDLLSYENQRDNGGIDLSLSENAYLLRPHDGMSNAIDMADQWVANEAAAIKDREQQNDRNADRRALLAQRMAKISKK